MQRIYVQWLIASLLLLVGSYQEGTAQELRATVSVNFEQIPIDRREDIITMQNDVEIYLNNQRYTNTEWEGDPIPVDVSIFLISRSGNFYSARLVVSSRRPILGSEGSAVAFQAYDDEWVFPYARNAVLSYQRNSFDPFTSLIDYYMFVVIGMDFDTFGETDGTEWFERARDIWQLGSAADAAGYDQQSEPGEITRYSIVSELTELRYEPFRELIFAYYVDGLDEMASNERQALAAVDSVLTEMVKFKHRLSKASAFIQVFFDFKHTELGELLKSHWNRDEIYQKLLFLDPGHSTSYQEAFEGR